VKRSNYSDTDTKLEEFLAEVEERRIVGDKVQDIQEARLPGIGVVCVLENAPSEKLSALFEAGKAVAIFEKSASGYVVCHKGVLALVNFLQFITWRYYRVQGAVDWFLQIPTKSL
jgi:hypothetical protein